MSFIKKLKHIVTTRDRARESQNDFKVHRSLITPRRTSNPPESSRDNLSVLPRTGSRGGEAEDVADAPHESKRISPPAPVIAKNSQWTNQASRIAVQGNTTVSGDQNFYITSASPQGHAKSGSVAESDRSLTELEKACLASLNTDTVSVHKHKTNAWLDGTLEWLTQVPSWQSWLSATTNRMLLVTGHAGCGKSTLISYATDALEKALPEEVTSCTYFFDGAVVHQCDPCNLLRSLIHQIVCLHPKLVRIVRKAADMQGPQFFHSLSALQTVFTKLITHKRLCGTVLVIDAIDECEESAQIEVVDWLVAVLRSVAPRPIKILLTSRPGSRAVREFEKSPETISRFRLEDDPKMVGEDVRRLIHKRVLGLQNAGLCGPPVADDLQRLLEDRADGTFLWVSLAISLLGRKRFIKVNDIEKIVAQLPPRLMDLYGSIFMQIPDEDRELVAKALRLMVACERHLNISELNVLLFLDAGHRSTSEIRESFYLANVQTVESLLGALVKIVDSRVMLVHHTLKEYLISDHSTNEGRVAGLMRHDEHSRDFSIAETCMRYLLLKDLADIRLDGTYPDPGSSPTSPAKEPTHYRQDPADSTGLHLEGLFDEPGQVTGDSTSLISAQYELYDYAARFWALHFQRCRPSEMLSLEALALQLYQGSTTFGWFNYHTATNGKAGCFPAQPDMLTFSCYLGHSHMTRKLVLEQCYRPAFGPACYWAAAMGHEPCLRILTSHDECDISSFSYQAQSALSIAAKNGYLEVVDCLLASGKFDVNSRASQYRTPLSLAAGAGHEHIVIRLLEEENIDIDLPDSAGASPIFWAVSADSPPTIKKIVSDGRSHPDFLDLSHRNALSWACEYGFMECVEALLNGGVPSNVQDSLGRSPLIYAVMSGNLEVVKRLVKHDKANIGLKDCSGRNAVSWAAQGRNPRVIAYLLRHDPHSASVEDHDGWAPIAWAMDPPERSENAALLMPYLSKELNDGAWVSLFALALRWGSFTVARLLVANEAFDINAMDNTRRTALGYAAAIGNVEFVRQILMRPGVMESNTDINGDTAYSLAASNHHQRVCELLRDPSDGTAQ